MSWRVQVERGSAGDLHATSARLASTGPVQRTVRVMQVEGPALVLGSGQPAWHADQATARWRRVEIVRRRSGGGAVLIVPGEAAWVDLLLPAGDSLWDTDVGRSAWWAGEVWAAALGELGAGPVGIWRGPMRRTRWSSWACFAGLGPGEVTLGGSKVVGISQRRSRHGALFQTVALARWNPSELVSLLALGARERAEMEKDLLCFASGTGLDPAELVEALLASLPS